VRAGAYLEVTVRLGYLQLLEEEPRHGVVVVLPGMDDALPEAPAEGLRYRCVLDELGPHADHRENGLHSPHSSPGTATGLIIESLSLLVKAASGISAPTCVDGAEAAMLPCRSAWTSPWQRKLPGRSSSQLCPKTHRHNQRRETVS
jgi:hypothetical protein